MNRLVLSAFCTLTLGTLALAACASPPTYAPATGSSSSGFSDQRIEADRYRVTFRGAGPSAQIQDFALLRASDLTLQAGYDWFQVVERTEDANAYSGSTFSIGAGAGGVNYGGGHGGHTSTGLGVGVSKGFDLGSPNRTIAMEIKMGKGQRPDDPRAYDARSVAQSVHERMGPPPAR